MVKLNLPDSTLVEDVAQMQSSLFDEEFLSSGVRTFHSLKVMVILVEELHDIVKLAVSPPVYPTVSHFYLLVVLLHIIK